MGFFIRVYEKLLNFLNKSKLSLKFLYQKKFIKAYSIFIYFLNLCLWLGFYLIFTKSSQDILILHYNTDFGIDLLGSRLSFIKFPLLSLFFIILYKIVLIKFRQRESFKFLAHFLLIHLLCFNVFLILSLYSLYFINF